MAYVSDGAINTAKGTLGGLHGAASKNYLLKKNGGKEKLPACADIILKDGETIASYCTGGGGYGYPWERPIEKVKKDVIETWISRRRAKEIYGVVLNSKFEIDFIETKRCRKKLSLKKNIK